MRPNVLPLVTGAVALACGVLVFAPAGLIDGLAYDRHAILSGEIWRLWSAHLVHFSAQQAGIDAAVFFIAGSVAEKEIGMRRMAIALALGAPCISLGLLLTVPDLSHYRGASGIAMLVALLAGAALWSGGPLNRMLLALLAFGVVIKTACEAFGISAHLAGLPPDVVVAWQAHVLGAGLAWLMILAHFLAHSLRRLKIRIHS